MVREQLKNHSLSGAMESPSIIRFEEEVGETQITQLLRMIYNNAEYDRQGDISAYLSSETSPELRQYIFDNILSIQTSSIPVPEGIDDDLIAEYTRDETESIYDYKQRLGRLFEQSANDFKELQAVQKNEKGSKESQTE